MLQYTYKYNNITNRWELSGGSSMSGIDEKNGWSIPHWPNQYDGEWTDWKMEKALHCQHKWIDTGMRKTFCKHCDVEGDYDPMTGNVTVVFKNKEEIK